jgi:hypothetical protein
MTTKAPRVGKISETIHARNGLFCKVLCNIDIPQYDQRKKREGVVMEKKTSENVWRSFNHTNSEDEHKRSFAKIPKNVVNGNPGIVFFVLISKKCYYYITNVLYSRVKTIFSNKIHVNTKIDSDS